MTVLLDGQIELGVELHRHGLTVLIEGAVFEWGFDDMEYAAFLRLQDAVGPNKDRLRDSYGHTARALRAFTDRLEKL